jgi:hypothetical protein
MSTFGSQEVMERKEIKHNSQQDQVIIKLLISQNIGMYVIGVKPKQKKF